MDFAGHAIIATSPDGIIQTFNHAAEEMLGYKAKEVINILTPAIIHEPIEVVERAKIFSEELGIDLKPGFEVFVAKSRKGLVNEHEWTCIRKNGTRFPVLLTISALKDQNDNIFGFLGIAQDISERKLAIERIEIMATHDELTGLPRRYLLQDRIAQLLAHINRSQESGAIMVLDLDYFKNVNDTLDHEAGDVLLKEVARRLTAIVRKEDTVACLGGDEFVILLFNSSIFSLEMIAAKVTSTLTYPFFINNQEIRIGASIGIAIMLRDGHDAVTLLKNADTAMYQAKNSGRNTYQFFSNQIT